MDTEKNQAAERRAPPGTAPKFTASAGRNAAFMRQGVTCWAWLPSEGGVPGAVRECAPYLPRANDTSRFCRLRTFR